MKACWVFGFGVLALLTACGSGDGGRAGGDAAPIPRPVSVPTLQLQVRSIKSFDFAWAPDAQATSFELLEDADGGDGLAPAQVIATLPAGSHAYQLGGVFLPFRLNATYTLRACNALGCAASQPVGTPSLNPAIGFFKTGAHSGAGYFGLGLSLSPDGTFLAVGMPREHGVNEGIDSPPVMVPSSAVGAVYVFRRDPSGWVQDAYLKPAKALQGSSFGSKLSWSGLHDGGRTLLVGALDDSSAGVGPNAAPDASGPLSSGAAYVFRRSATGHWSQVSYLKSPEPVANGLFGAALALSQDGRWAAIGEPNGTGMGRVHVFEETGGTWSLQASLRGRNTEAGDAFGRALGLSASGDRLVVGAGGEDGSHSLVSPDSRDADEGLDESGAVYMFSRAAGNPWAETAYIKSPTPRTSGWFGDELAMAANGQVMTIGEEHAEGRRVHVFAHEAGQWVYRSTLVAPHATALWSFGEAMDLSADGTVLALGDAYEQGSAAGLVRDPGPMASLESGAVFLYRTRDHLSWSLAGYVKASNNRDYLTFGRALSLSQDGQALAVFGSDDSGATGIGGDQNDTSLPGSGAVYLY